MSEEFFARDHTAKCKEYLYSNVGVLSLVSPKRGIRKVLEESARGYSFQLCEMYNIVNVQGQDLI